MPEKTEQRTNKREPVETRPPAPTECICTERKPLGESSELLVTDAACPKHGLKTFLAEALAENSEPVEQAAPPRPLWQVSELPTGLHPDRKAMGKIPVGYWFLYDSPSCTQRYSIQERTESGCSIVCSSPYTHDGVKKDFLKIVSLYNAELAAPAAIEQARPQTPQVCASCFQPITSKAGEWVHADGKNICPDQDLTFRNPHPLRMATPKPAAAEPAPERTPPTLRKMAANTVTTYWHNEIHDENPRCADKVPPCEPLSAAVAVPESAAQQESEWETNIHEQLDSLNVPRVATEIDGEPVQKTAFSINGRFDILRARQAEPAPARKKVQRREELFTLHSSHNEIHNEVASCIEEGCEPIEVVQAAREKESTEPAPTPSRAEILQQIQSDIHYEATHKKGLAWLVLTIEKRIEAEASSLGTKKKGETQMQISITHKTMTAPFGDLASHLQDCCGGCPYCVQLCQQVVTEVNGKIGSDNPQNVCKFHGSENQTEVCTICFCEGKESVTRG